MNRIAVSLGGLAVLLAFYSATGPRDEAESKAREIATVSGAGSEPVAPVFESSLSPSVLDGVQERLARREYWASETEEGLQAPNRAHDLRSHFDARGVSVVDRDAKTHTPLVELALARLGRDGLLASVPSGELVDLGSGRVEIRRPALGLVEWFENSSVGLEQGFTLSERPTPVGAAAEALVLELSVSGARASLAGDRIRLETATGRSLEYGKLVVVDGTDMVLAARFEVPSEDRIRIVVDDRDANYPIVIDPLLTGIFDTAVESNQAGSEFAVSVASAGDVNADGFDDVIIGATLYDLGQTDEGAAFVFLGGPSGIVLNGGGHLGNPDDAHAVLQSDQPFGGFGRLVASAGDVNGDGYADVVVGAYTYDAGHADEGVAFVFHGSATGIASGGVASAAGSMQSDQTNGYMGFGIGAAGDVNGDGYGDLVVGAYGYDAPSPDEGAAFVLLGSPAGIGNRNPTNAHARLEGDQANALFGLSVASAGDIDADGFADVIVGAPNYWFGTHVAGGAFVYRGGATGIASGNGASAHAQFSGDQTTGINSSFGNSVAGAGDVNGDGYGDIIIGAPLHTNFVAVEGAAFIFHGSGLGFPNGPYLHGSANRILTGFGRGSRHGASVASAGDVNGDGYSDVVVGAFDFASPETKEGMVTVYVGSAAGVVQQMAVIESNEANAVLGYSVASAGDVNGDGYDDIIAGAYLADNVDGGAVDEGVAFVFHGGRATPLRDASRFFEVFPPFAIDPSRELVFPESPTPELPTIRVASAGDVNGDGLGDVVVGVPDYDDGAPGEGAAFVFLGSTTQLPLGDASNAHVKIDSNQAGAQLGDRVVSAGDVNGDGYADLIVGAPSFDGPEIDEGAAFVFLGSASGIGNGSLAAAHARLESNQAGALFGRVASAGDVNGDGYSDVLVGAPLFDSPQADEGASFVFLGSATGLANANPANAHARFESNQPGARLGWSGRSAGDVNGDGFDDVILGAPEYSALFPRAGIAFIHHGSPTGLTSGGPGVASARISGTQTNALLGYSVDSAGDFNGDGHADVIVGAPALLGGSSHSGNAHIFFGLSGGIGDRSPGNADRTIAGSVPEPNKYAARFGQDVAGAGDLDNDGFGDVVISSAVRDSTFNVYTRFAAVHNGAPGGSLRPLNASRYLLGAPIPVGYEDSDAYAGSAGDFDGDGFGDLIVGGRLAGGDRAAAIFYGYGRGRHVGTRQRRTSGGVDGEIPLGGFSDSTDRFAIMRELASPRGRERARLEVEVCGVGRPFGHASCVRSIPAPAWIDLGLFGTSIETEVSGLASGQAYSWRVRGQYVALNSTRPGIVPIVKNGPWFRVQGRSTSRDFRTLPEPGIGIALFSGSVFAAAVRGRVLRSLTRKMDSVARNAR